jgi:hypothetical protein
MELLVVARDRSVDESPGKWKRGDVVAVKPDGWEWGLEERNPAKFTIVKVNDRGMKEDYASLLEEDEEPSLINDTKDLMARRKVKLTEAFLKGAEKSGGRRETLSKVLTATEARGRPSWRS